MEIINKGEFKYGNKVAEKWSASFILQELDRLITFLQNDNIYNSDILSISMLLLASKSVIKTEKQFDYIKYKFKNNDTVSGSFELIKDMIKNRWILNSAKGTINSNIAKLVILNNYFTKENENNNINQDILDKQKRLDNILLKIAETNFKKNQERRKKQLEIS